MKFIQTKEISMQDLTVLNIMTHSFETLNPRDDLQRAALLMRRSKLDVLPVIGGRWSIDGVNDQRQSL